MSRAEPMIAQVIPNRLFQPICSLKNMMPMSNKNGTCVCITTTPMAASKPSLTPQNMVPKWSKVKVAVMRSSLKGWMGIFGKKGISIAAAMINRNVSIVNGSKCCSAIFTKTKLNPHNMVTIRISTIFKGKRYFI